MFYPYTFQTGKVLEQGKNEIGVHIPANVTIARGILRSGLELRAGAGLSGLDIFGANLGLGKSVTRSTHLFSSGYADTEIFFNSEHEYAGMRFTGTCALGYYFRNDFGVFAPIKAGYLFYDLAGSKGGNVVFVPGLGITYERRHVAVRLTGNVPLPTAIHGTDDAATEVLQMPYAGLQLLFCW